MKSLRFLSLCSLLSGHAEALVCQVSGDPVEGNDPFADIMAAGEKLNRGPLDQLKVGYQETASTEPQHKIIYTEGLNPCIALLMKGTNREGKTIACLSHLNAPLSDRDPPQTRATHTEQVGDHYEDCKRQLVAKGMVPGSLRVLFHAAERGNEAQYDTSSDQQQNDINFRALLDAKVAAGEIPDYRAVYKNTVKPNSRTLTYDLDRGTFSIKHTSPELSSDPLLEGEF